MRQHSTNIIIQIVYSTKSKNVSRLYHIENVFAQALRNIVLVNVVCKSILLVQHLTRRKRKRILSWKTETSKMSAIF